MSEKIVFGQSAAPSLYPGEYTLTVTQKLKNINPQGKKDTIDETFQTAKKFIISSKRFALNPDDIYAIYPSPNMQGEFSNSLPHVVLKFFTLPWERTPYKIKEDSSQTPWMGLLIMDESESPPPIQSITLAQLQKNGLPQDVFFPSFEYESGQQSTDSCNVIDVPVSHFKKIAPSLSDLKYLAHTRKVSSTNKIFNYFATPHKELETFFNSNEGKEEGENFAVVVGNRLPNPGKQTTVYLVSFENFEEVLPGSPKEVALPKEVKMIRLICFKSWSFSTITHPQHFEAVIRNLNKMPLIYSYHAAGPEIENPLSMGYLPFNHYLREGDKTVSWYRGPLAPYGIKKFLKKPIESSDAVLRYDPTHGMFDTSYAQAWQLGQLLALQNRHFRMALYCWRKQSLQKIAHQVETKAIYEKLSSINLSLNRSNAKITEKHQLKTPLRETLLETMKQGLSTLQNKE